MPSVLLPLLFDMARSSVSFSGPAGDFVVGSERELGLWLFFGVYDLPSPISLSVAYPTCPTALPYHVLPGLIYLSPLA